MLTTMDTLDSLSHSSAAKEGDVEVIEPLPPPAPAAPTLGTQGSLLASLPSRIGALWTTPEPGKRLGSPRLANIWSLSPALSQAASLPSCMKGPLWHSLRGCCMAPPSHSFSVRHALAGRGAPAEQPTSRPLPDDRLAGASSETSLESLIRVARDDGLSDASPWQSEVGARLS